MPMPQTVQTRFSAAHYPYVFRAMLSGWVFTIRDGYLEGELLDAGYEGEHAVAADWAHMEVVMGRYIRERYAV